MRPNLGKYFNSIESIVFSLENSKNTTAQESTGNVVYCSKAAYSSIYKFLFRFLRKQNVTDTNEGLI